MEVAIDFKNDATFSVFKRSEALFYGHVKCRWVTLVPALQKVEERQFQRNISCNFYHPLKTMKKQLNKIQDVKGSRVIWRKKKLF